NLIDAPRCPRMHRRVYITEGPLVGRQLSVWMHVPLTPQQHELVFFGVWIKNGERGTKKNQIPNGGPPGIPPVGHRNDVVVVEVSPLAVSSIQSLRWRGRFGGVAFEPRAHIVIVELFAPEQSAQRLAHHALGVL